MLRAYFNTFSAARKFREASKHLAQYMGDVQPSMRKTGGFKVMWLPAR